MDEDGDRWNGLKAETEYYMFVDDPIKFGCEMLESCAGEALFLLDPNRKVDSRRLSPLVGGVQLSKARMERGLERGGPDAVMGR